MPAKPAQSFIIIERSFGVVDTVRTALIRSGARVHIFQSYPPALILLARKKVDGVVVEFDNDKATADFCAAVRRLDVPIVYSTPKGDDRDIRRFGFEVNFPRRRESPTIFVPYRRPKLSGQSKDVH